jgi:hypothetical protein
MKKSLNRVEIFGGIKPRFQNTPHRATARSHRLVARTGVTPVADASRGATCYRSAEPNVRAVAWPSESDCGELPRTTAVKSRIGAFKGVLQLRPRECRSN